MEAADGNSPMWKRQEEVYKGVLQAVLKYLHSLPFQKISVVFKSVLMSKTYTHTNSSTHTVTQQENLAANHKSGFFVSVQHRSRILTTFFVSVYQHVVQ